MALRTEVHADPEAVARRAAAWIAGTTRQAIEQRDRCVLALSGGTTPLPMLRVLATTPIDWRKVEVVQVDERVAPGASPDRNLAQLRAALLAHIPLPAAQIHPMPVEDVDLVAAAERYGRLLTSLAGAPPRLDIVVLGLGADGHTASLVPGDAALDIRDADVAVTAPYQGRRRMTLTFPVINRARHILWLVTGADKAEMLARLVQGDTALPASRVRRASALLLADRAAA
ncbi:MAG: 6-phosphogluconolactonase, partial [Porticoccaceae bacterium]